MACITDTVGIRIIAVVKFIITLSIVSWTLSLPQQNYARIVTGIVLALIVIGTINSFIVAQKNDPEKLRAHTVLLSVSVVALFVPVVLLWVSNSSPDSTGLTIWSIVMGVLMLWERRLCNNLIANLTARVIVPPQPRIVEVPVQSPQPTNVIHVNVANTGQPIHPVHPMPPQPHPYPYAGPAPAPYYGQPPVPTYGQPPPPYSPPAPYYTPPAQYYNAPAPAPPPPDAGFTTTAAGFEPPPVNPAFATNDNYPTKPGMQSEQMQRSAPSAPDL